ncbi:MAG: Ig-like domain-containing protein, partial [Oscillospiraceae bacterium]|nr:Ig-like domain-containing protein [Oscillospiraceae bacterium]
MAKRSVSLFLVLLMIFSMLPAGAVTASAQEADAPAAEAVVIDFKQFAKEAAQQDWYDDLATVETLDGYETKRASGVTRGTAMTADQRAAYDSMMTWMAQTQPWTINNDVSNFTGGGGNRLYLCPDDDVSWGISHNTYYRGTNSDTALSLKVDVPAAGRYKLDLAVSQVVNGSKDFPSDGWQETNFGFVDIYVNGEKFYHEYSFKGTNLVEQSFGTVELEEGENTITFYAVKCYVGNTAATPCWHFNLSSLALTPLEAENVKTGGRKTVTLQGAYLPFDAQVSDSFTVISDDDDIATGYISAEGKLIVEGISVGKAELTVKDGSDVLCVVPVQVQPFDPSALETITVDFKQFAREASVQPWWDKLAAMDTLEGFELRRVGQTYNKRMTAEEQAAWLEMNKYLSKNGDWRFAMDAWDSAGAGGERAYFCADENVDWGILFNSFYINSTGNSDLNLAVDAEEAGWYSLNVDVYRQGTDGDYPNDVSFSAGGAYIDVLVNGEYVREDHPTKGEGMQTTGFGPVYLEEGENTVSLVIVGNVNGLDSNKDYEGDTIAYSGRANLYLRGMDLVPLGGVQVAEGGSKLLDLRSTYLAFDAKTDELTAVADDENIAQAEIDDNGDLVIMGLAAGETDLTVMDGDEAVCTFLVKVVEQAEPAAEDGIVTVTEDGWYSPEIVYYKRDNGSEQSIYLDDAYLGTIRDLADAKTLASATLRPVYLQAGEYELDAAETAVVEFVLHKEEAPELAIFAKELSAKQYRLMESPIVGKWLGGKGDDLVDATWSVTVSDEAALSAEVIPAQPGQPAMLQVTGLQPVEDGWVEVTAEVSGVEASVTIPVTVFAPVALASMDVELKGIEKGQIARLTTQEFVFDMVGVDGEAIYANEANITYDLSTSGVVEIDEENHTLYALANGEVTITVTAEQGGVSFTKTLSYVVADHGENRLDDETSYFEGGTVGNWGGTKVPGSEGAMAWTEVCDDGTGNLAMKVVLNSETSFKDSSSAGSTLYVTSGSYAKVTPGHMYEMTVKVKIDDLKLPENAVSYLRIIPQLYDYPTASGGTVVNEIWTSTNVPTDRLGEWIEVKLPVRGPVNSKGEIYVMPRLSIQPNFSTDDPLSGWELTAWFDDFEVREVGFETVGFTFTTQMETITRPGTVLLQPLTTTGSVICPDEGLLAGNVKLESLNTDVVRVTSTMKEQTVGSYVYPAFNVQLVGLNDTAQLKATYTFDGYTREGYCDVTASGHAEVLRDVFVELDGFESLVVNKGETAQASLTGKTTYLNEISEEEFRENGDVYFSSSDVKVAKVDAKTGVVTCVGEGTATIYGYGNWEGNVVKGTAVITVTDETDLTAISLSANTDYVGIGNTLVITPSGTKASGGRADMSLYPVAWSVDDETVAVIDENGRLTGVSEGTVTVTATIGVKRVAVSAQLEIEVVSNDQLAGDIIRLSFLQGQLLDWRNRTLEQHGYNLNAEKTYKNGETIKFNAQGFEVQIPEGEALAIDFVVKKEGWYQVFANGKEISYLGKYCDIILDEKTFIDQIDFGGGTTSNTGAGGFMNTVWLDAGVHTFEVISTATGTQFLGEIILYPTSDPRAVDVQLTAEKTQLVVGEKLEIVNDLTDANGNDYFLRLVEKTPVYTNYYMLSNSDASVATLSGTTLTATAPGTTTITLTGELLGEKVTTSLTVTVIDSAFVSATLDAEATTVKPEQEDFPLQLTTYGADGAAQSAIPEGVEVAYVSEDPSIVTVSSNGMVHVTGKEGSARITATVTERERVVELEIWITVTKGKTEPTVFTPEEREAAQENVLKYAWAWNMKESAVAQADYYLEHLDQIYDSWIFDTFPRTMQVGFKGEVGYLYCRYCGVDIVSKYHNYPWIVDPIENPWKITCPDCGRDFPSNDFGSYWQSGLGEDGRFHEELADRSLLVNELYPEMGEGWGVDDGWGYNTGEKDVNGVEIVHTYINVYLAGVLWGLGEYDKHSNMEILKALMEAYLYTGDEKYGNAGAILIDRIADIYPETEILKYDFGKYAFSDGGGGHGKFIGITWDAIGGITLAKAVDAFWPCMDNPEVIEYLKTKYKIKGMEPEDITPEYVRKNCDEGILMEIYKAAASWQIDGNFGMSEAAVAYSAVALDQQPTTDEMLEWVFKSEKKEGYAYNMTQRGGDVMRRIIEAISRDSFGDEGSYAYNSLWETYLLDLADALDGVEGYDLWEMSKFVYLYTGAMRLTVCGRLTPQIHESGSVQSTNFLPNVERMTTAFLKTGNVEVAKALYAANNNSTEGLRADIFTKDPETGIRNAVQNIVDEHGTWDMSRSDMLCGYGIAILREGPHDYLGAENAHEFSDYWIGFGYMDSGHAQRESLNLDLEAFGLNLSSSMGYPMVVLATNPERMQWVMNTVSNNTVVVNNKGQLETEKGGFPYHFEDAGKFKVMDIEDSRAYPETDIYRRTLVAVDNGSGVHYAVDFFRVLGGYDHVFSFHGATMIEPTTEGLEMVKQPMGTYAGADIPYGDHQISGMNEANLNAGSGYSWLDDVYRDAEPETTFSVDWQIEDFNNRLSTSSGIHLKMTMMSEEPMDEVALADGHPPKKSANPDHVEYVLVRRSGNNGLDSLFTTVFEPYQYDSYIATTELVDVKLVEGTEEINDRAAAVKVTLVNGREDFVVYATNPGCTYEIYDTNGKVKFTFRGFAGLCSYEKGKLIYAHGNEVTTITDSSMGSILDNTLPAYTGTVTDFTRGMADSYSMTIRLDQSLTTDLTDHYIYVNNDGVENGVYRIYGAEADGKNVVLDLHSQILVREYVDEFDLDLGFIHNIEVGQSFTIPLGHTFDSMAFLNNTADQVVKAGYRMDLQVGIAESGATYEAEGLAKGMKFDAATGKITWTPSKTQVGRYPIAVRAMTEDGDVIATMEFVIYVVAYTGASYDPSVCKHVKALTYTVGDVVETVCPACGLITKTGPEDAPEDEPSEPIELIDIAGTNMNLGNELALNFMFPKALDESKSY